MAGASVTFGRPYLEVTDGEALPTSRGNCQKKESV